MYEVLFYTAANDECPVQSFFDELAAKPRGKVLRFVSHLASLGPDLPRPYADTLRDKIRELRVPFGRLQIRVLAEEIDRAVRRMEDWLSRDR